AQRKRQVHTILFARRCAVMRPYAFQSRARPKLFERAVIVTSVLAGHILLGILLCWQGPPAFARDLGAKGQVVTLSLVDARALEPVSQPAHPVTTKPEPEVAQATPAKQPVSDAPSESAPKQEITQAVDETGLKPATVTADALSPDITEPDNSEPSSSEVALSEADMATLAAFAPDAAASQGTPDAPCHLTQSLAQIFAQSPEIKQALTDLPASERSVANAVMLWDGGWSPESRTGGRGLLRALLIKAIADARDDCLSQINRGPVLFMVPDTQATVVVAVGSGLWRWGDVLAGNENLQKTLLAGDFFISSSASNFPSAP
ncbi:MAG: hypothetical protein WBQ60_10165, partial [Asticcacaulis sp.]